jgi:LysR family transcriptional regulator, nitrogen assimilation regulatory protein
MNLKRLSYFLRIAELGSMNRASEVLHVAQPALTRQIHLLEKELGAVLFTRTARGMQLTREGEQLRAEVIGPLRQLDFAFQNARLPAGKVEGSVSLGMPSSVRCVLAHPLISRVAAAEPGIKMRIIEGQTDHLVEWLIAGQIDIALLYGPSPDHRIIDRGMVVEDLMLVGSRESALSPDKPVNFKRLSRFPLILPGSRHGIMSTLEKNAYITKTNINIILRIDSFELTKQLVMSGAGYTILPCSAFITEHEAGLVTYTRIENPVLTRQIVTAATEQCRVPRIISRLDVLIQQEISVLAASGRWPGKLLINPDG